MVTLQLKQIKVPSGQQILLQNISWLEFENILEELGENRASRLSYERETLEIMTPLSEHEDDKEILSDLIKAFLEEREIEFRALGSTTFKNPLTKQGIEPDQCFYIQNEAKIRGKKRIDLTIDPPPDLAIEIDITSRTHPNIYESLGVPELWCKNGQHVQINVLQEGKYIEVLESRIFPTLSVDVLLNYLAQSKTLGRNQIMKQFRQWLRNLTTTT